MPSANEPGSSPGIEMEAASRGVIDAIRDLNLSIMMQGLGPDPVLSVVVRDHTIRLHLPLAHTDLIQRFILQYRTLFEIDALNAVRAELQPGAVVVDAGANIGTHSLFFALLCGASEVIAFEPMRTSFLTLQRNIALNGASAIRAMNVALGAVRGSAALHFFSHWNTGATVLDLAQTGPYPVMPLDDLDLRRLDFLKLDVEGSQLAVLAGAAATLARCRPRIWVELRQAHGEVKPGHVALRQLGYTPARQLSPDDWLFVPETG